jgi:hypothetical protein
MDGILLPGHVAVEFQRVRSWQRFESAQALLDAVDSFMTERGLAASKISRLDVAEHVLNLRKPAQLSTPEQESWERNQAEGIGDRRVDPAVMARAEELALAGRVAQADEQGWRSMRQELGISKTTFQHLAGM